MDEELARALADACREPETAEAIETGWRVRHALFLENDRSPQRPDGAREGNIRDRAAEARRR